MDEITRKWFDVTTVEVVRAPELAAFHSDEELIRLSGAPRGSRLEVTSSIEGIELKVINEDLLCEPLVRFIRPLPEGLVFEIRNAAFVLRPKFRGLGIGPRSVAIELHEASRLDYFSKVVTFAVGDWTSRSGDHAMNGYIVWARMGFNAKLPEPLLSHPRLPPACRGVHDVIGLIASGDGHDFWLRYGSSLWMEFSLREPSASWERFRHYARQRDIEVTLP